MDKESLRSSRETAGCMGLFLATSLCVVGISLLAAKRRPLELGNITIALGVTDYELLHHKKGQILYFRAELTNAIRQSKAGNYNSPKPWKYEHFGMTSYARDFFYDPIQGQMDLSSQEIKALMDECLENERLSLQELKMLADKAMKKTIADDIAELVEDIEKGIFDLSSYYQHKHLQVLLDIHFGESAPKICYSNSYGYGGLLREDQIRFTGEVLREQGYTSEDLLGLVKKMPKVQK